MASFQVGPDEAASSSDSLQTYSVTSFRSTKTYVWVEFPRLPTPGLCTQGVFLHVCAYSLSKAWSARDQAQVTDCPAWTLNILEILFKVNLSALISFSVKFTYG